MREAAQSAALESLQRQGFTLQSTDDGVIVVRRGADVRIVRQDGSVRRCDRIK
jgi:hypothetical protein